MPTKPKRMPSGGTTRMSATLTRKTGMNTRNMARPIEMLPVNCSPQRSRNSEPERLTESATPRSSKQHELAVGLQDLPAGLDELERTSDPAHLRPPSLTITVPRSQDGAVVRRRRKGPRTPT